MNNLLRVYQPFLKVSLLVLAITSVSRIIIMLAYADRVSAQSSAVYLLFQGLRFDLVLLGWLIILPILISPFLVTSQLGLRFWKPLFIIWAVCTVCVTLFMELATIPFVEQFDVRPNFLFLEYLVYPKELLSTLWGAYRLPMIVALLIVVGAGIWMFRQSRYWMASLHTIAFWKVVPVTLVLVLLAVMMGRSTLAHRSVNPSIVANTTDSLVNDIPLSSLYTLVYAATSLTHEEAGNLAYGKMLPEDALQIVRADMAIKDQAFLDSNSTFRRSSASRQYDKPKNLVILLQESMGAEFVGSLGGIGVTPELDKLAKQGWWFERLYATGTRSVRGIEAVVTGFPPTPARSVVKLNKSQHGFFSLASALSNQGYETSFIYGGESHFDNMRRFFMGNGFQKIVDENDYVDPVFKGSWGVSDEDLMRQAHREFEQLGDKPFFSLVFSSSNHTPFEYPDGRIELFDAEKQTVNNAVKYADYAIGEFFRLAKQSSYWDNTVFVVVADHNSRVYGNSLIPIERFRIPGLIIGSGIEAASYPRIASQIDLGPTLLSLIGVDSVNPMPGRDLTKLPNSVPGRALMQFNAVNAYLQEYDSSSDRVALLRRNKEAQTFQYKNNKLHEVAEDIDLENKALGYVTWAADAYHNRRYSPVPDGGN